MSKPSYWMHWNGSEFIYEFIGNGRPSLNRFVLDKCHVRMNYDMCFQRFLEACRKSTVIGRLRKKRKWLTPAPTPVSTWKSREEEVLGWAGYSDEFSSWAAGGSLEFLVEIQHSSRWPDPKMERSKFSIAGEIQEAYPSWRQLFTTIHDVGHLVQVLVKAVLTFRGIWWWNGIAVNQQLNGYELLVLLHSSADTYESYQNAAMQWRATAIIQWFRIHRYWHWTLCTKFSPSTKRLRMFLYKTTFAENWFLERIWCGDDGDGFCHFGMAIWNVVYCLRMCMFDNKLQTFSTWFCLNNFVDENLWRYFYVSLHAAMWATENCVLSGAWCFFQRLHGRLIHLRLGWFYCWNLMLQHGARWDNQDSTVQRLTDGRTPDFGCFRVLRKSWDWVRSSHGIWVWFACVFLQALEGNSRAEMQPPGLECRCDQVRTDWRWWFDSRWSASKPWVVTRRPKKMPTRPGSPTRLEAGQANGWSDFANRWCKQVPQVRQE